MVLRELKLLVIFLVAAFFSGWAVWASAETIAATSYAAGQDSYQPTLRFRVLLSSWTYNTSYTSLCDQWRAYNGRTKGTIGCSDTRNTSVLDGADGGGCAYDAGGYCGGSSYQNDYTCNVGYTKNTSNPPLCVNTTTVYKCPATGGWTLSGSTCTRPDCPAGQARDATSGACVACAADEELYNGVCVKKCIGDQFRGSDGACKCQVQSAGITQFTTSVPAGGSFNGTGCKNGCTVQVGTSFCFGFTPPYTCFGLGSATGAICGANATPGQNQPISVTLTGAPKVPADTSGTDATGTKADPKNTPDNASDPVSCGAAGGSYGVFNGVGKCLTPTNDNTMQKVDTNKLTTTNSDNSTTTKTTTTVTVNNGVSTTTTTNTTTTNCNAAGSCTSSNSGTNSSQGTGSGPEGSELCKSDPTNPLCKADWAKESTQQQVRDLLDPGKNGKEIGWDSDGSQAQIDATKAQHDKIGEELAKVGTSNDPAKSKMDEFRSNMEQGWFDVIPINGCSPFDVKVGLWTWHFDHCPTAAKIAEIGAYCMWVMFAFAVFKLVTERTP